MTQPGTIARRAKELVFLAGANGAGKTTVANHYVASRFPHWPQVNADRLLEVARSHAASPNLPQTERVRERWQRSLRLLPWFAHRADRVVVLDNSGRDLRTLALRHRGGPLEGIDRDHPATQLLLPLVGSLVIAQDA